MQMQGKSATLKIYCDEDAENPRNWDNVGTMICFHRRYAFGDKHDYLDPQDFLESDEAKNAYVMLPVYLYDHSIQKLSVTSFSGREQHADWDSGQVGYIFVSSDDVKRLTDLEPNEQNKDSLRKILTSEVEIYSAYIEGDTYGFSIVDFQGNILDSCGGFYGGNMSEVLWAMKEQVDPKYGVLFDKAIKDMRSSQMVMS